MLAPVVNAIFWKIAMKYATEPQRADLDNIVDDFYAPFSGPFDAWRLMSVLRFGDPAEVPASIPSILPQLPMPTLIFHGTHDKAVPEIFARRASSLIPQSKVIMVDSGHFIPLNCPEVVATQLPSFFGGAGAAN
jgi:pimeloyl-ACP methyl ester carboxylesterase